MKRGPSLVARLIASTIEITAPPRPVTLCGAEMALAQSWYESPSVALEALEKWEPQILSLLQRELSQLHQTGRFATFAFNSSSPQLIQGSAFVEPSDPAEVKEAKQRRAQHSSYLAALRTLSPRQFEMLCAGVLRLFGVQHPTLTPYSADEGLDFYGRLQLDSHIMPAAVFPGIHTQLSVWMIGQAKHYLLGKVSTPDVRDLVGAVTLAKGRAFASGTDKYADLLVRVCDPVFFLFFTTSSLTSDAWSLLSSSGVVGMDGEMLAAFLADKGVAQSTGKFDKAALIEWVKSFSNEISDSNA